MSSFRVLITGSREWKDRERMRFALASALGRNIARLPVVIVHGGARGADQMAAWWASSFDAKPELHAVDWRPGGIYNPYAGHARNQEMVNAGADVCVAFFQAGAANRGTSDCVKRAKLANIPVVEVWSDQ